MKRWENFSLEELGMMAVGLQMLHTGEAEQLAGEIAYAIAIIETEPARSAPPPGHREP